MPSCCHAGQSFNEILNEHKAVVDYAVGPYRSRFKSADIDEIICDAEYGLYLAFCRYDPSRGMKFTTFAVHIIRQRIIDGYRLRRSQRGVLNTAVSIDTVDDYGLLQSIEKGYQNVDDCEFVSLMLDSLDEQSRQLITLRFFDGLKMKEIAERTGLSLGLVRCQIYQTLKTLAEKFSDDRQLGKSNSG